MLIFTSWLSNLKINMTIGQRIASPPPRYSSLFVFFFSLLFLLGSHEPQFKKFLSSVLSFFSSFHFLKKLRSLPQFPFRRDFFFTGAGISHLGYLFSRGILAASRFCVLRVKGKKRTTLIVGQARFLED